jgi:ligand-binding sensor domain-containing protein
VRWCAGLMLASLLVCPAAGHGASGDWNVFVNASAVNRITCIGDSLWCATRGGILLFDLRDSSYTQFLDGLGFTTTDVSAVTVDGRASVWAAFTGSGIARIDRLGTDPTVTLYSATISQLMSDSVTCIAAAGDDVYYGSANGAAKFFDYIPTFEPVLSDSLSGIHVNDLLVRGDTLWVGCERGVALFKRSTYAYQLFRIGDVTSLCSSAGVVYCAAASGVWRFTGGAWVAVRRPALSPPLAVAAGGGALYCVTADSAYAWGGSSWTNITANMKSIFATKYRIGATVAAIRTVAVDSRATPWVGGMRELANRGMYISGYISGSWQNKSYAQLSQNGIVAFSLVPGEGIWASTRYFGNCYRSNTGQWIQYTKTRTPSDPAGLSYWLNNLALLHDTQGYLWCNSLDFDLDRITVNDPLNAADDEWAHYALNEGTITSNRFVRATEDPAGNRWFLSDQTEDHPGIYGINIVSADGAHWLSVNPSTAPEMAGGFVSDVAFGSNGRVFVALNGYGVQEWRTGGYGWSTLSNLNDDSWSTLVGPDDLASKDLYAIEQGPDGAIWMATANGLKRYRALVIDSISVKERSGDRGLLDAKVFDITFDGLGNLWVATDGGLNKIDPDGGIAAFTTFAAWRSDLYPSSVISPLPAASCKALVYDHDDDVLWIGTDNGMARLDVSPPSRVETPLASLILYPNPVYVSRGDTELRIARISGPVSIKVYTIEGELVHDVSGVEDGGVAWDLYPLTSDQFHARSGVYIVRVTSGKSSVVRKIAVVR